MDLQKAKILINKIEAMHKSMGADADNVSAIEKDLMRSYIRSLYEIFMDVPTTATPTASKVTQNPVAPKPTLPKPEPPKVTVAPPISHTPPPTIPEPTPTPRPEPAKVAPPEPKIIEVPESVKADPKPQPTPKKQIPPAPKPKSTVSEDVEELFEHSSSRELSEKLSNLPIKDLRKSMGLNEKIFTINELFGGSQRDFDTAIDELNSYSNFDQAKAYLINDFAVKNEWTKKSKIKKAKNFIKLIRRRYA